MNHIELKTANGKVILLPSSTISNQKIEIYKKPLQKATHPFRFYTRLNIKELTGVKAKNLSELLENLKTVSDSVIFYHTHDFLEEYHYLTPPPSNEFAIWVSYALNDAILAEKLSNIDIFDFSTIGALRNRITNVIEEHLNLFGGDRNCFEGAEFHFIKSISSIIPTPYVAHDLREFLQILHFISPNSLFFHIYEAKLRVGKIANDFSVWIVENLNQKELAEKISALDPYMLTIEGIRKKTIEIIDEHLKKEEFSESWSSYKT